MAEIHKDPSLSRFHHTTTRRMVKTHTIALDLSKLCRIQTSGQVRILTRVLNLITTQISKANGTKAHILAQATYLSKIHLMPVQHPTKVCTRALHLSINKLHHIQVSREVKAHIIIMDHRLVKLHLMKVNQEAKMDQMIADLSKLYPILVSQEVKMDLRVMVLSKLYPILVSQEAKMDLSKLCPILVNQETITPI